MEISKYHPFEMFFRWSLPKHVCDNAQRNPPAFEALLRTFERRLLKWINQQPGFLERIQAEILFRATPGPLVGDFRKELNRQLEQQWEATVEELSEERLDEVQSDGFWKEHIHGWLLSQPPLQAPAADSTIQGKPHRLMRLEFKLMLVGY